MMITQTKNFVILLSRSCFFYEREKREDSEMNNNSFNTLCREQAQTGTAVVVVVLSRREQDERCAIYLPFMFLVPPQQPSSKNVKIIDDLIRLLPRRK
jgi:hypothetical protein